MHVQPYPSTHIIKQQILMYAECTSDSEFKGKFAPDLVGKNSVPPLMTFLLNKVGVLFQHCPVQLQVSEACSSRHLYSQVMITALLSDLTGLQLMHLSE